MGAVFDGVVVEVLFDDFGWDVTWAEAFEFELFRELGEGFLLEGFEFFGGEGYADFDLGFWDFFNLMLHGIDF